MKAIALRAAIVAALPLMCLSAVAAEGPLAQKKGQGGSEIQGSAGPGGSQGDNGLEHCDKPMGAMAVVEPQDYVAQSLVALQPAVADRTDPHDGAAVELLHRRRARPWHAEHDAGARAAGVRRAAPGLEHGRRPDGQRRFRPDARCRVLGEQRRRRRRRARRIARRPDRQRDRRGRRRPEVQGSADQHAGH